MHDAEILTIGDELLRGELVDSNAAWLAAQLSALGLTVWGVSTVGDTIDAIAEAVVLATRRSRILVVSGGLGPTEDDRTVAALAHATGEPLERDPQLVSTIQQRFSEIGLRYTTNNAKQADLPRGGRALSNARGTAPGVAIVIEGCHVFCMPGVPGEMREMFEHHVAPWCRDHLARPPIARRTLKLFGIGEAQIDERLGGLLESVDHRGCAVSLHYRTTFPENHVTVIARSPSPGSDAADSVIAELEQEVLRRLQRYVFDAEGRPFSEAVVEALKEAGASVAVAESCTGGLIGDMLTRAAGSSEVFELGVVAYADRIKQQLLGVAPELLASDGAVSRSCVEAMARGVRERARATFGLAVSGIAGPGGGTLDKPVGTVHLALAHDGGTRHLQRRFPYDRQRNKVLSAYVALWLVYRQLRGDLDAADPLSGRWRAA